MSPDINPAPNQNPEVAAPPPPPPQTIPEPPEIVPPELEISPEPASTPDAEPGRWRRFWNWLASHKKYSVPAAIILILIILAGVPWSRYHLAGLALKKELSIKVIDSSAGTPVSGALVGSDGQQGQTDSNGIVRLHLPVGPQLLSVSKKYYSSATTKFTLPIFGSANTSVQFQATGRQVSLSVTNRLSGKPLSNVDITVAGTNAKTDDQGKALLVVPAGSTEEKASLSLDGFNQTSINLKISSQAIEQNTATLTPAGKVYFVSDKTGTLNIMKANLDGTGAEVVLSGTGQEKPSTTSLSQSPDGRFVAYEARRNASDKTAQLYIISAADDHLLSLDSGNTNFTIIGWLGDQLIYSLDLNATPDWQTGAHKIKSYDATNGKITLLDQTQGTDPDTQAGQEYGNVYLTANKVVYNKSWNAAADDSSLNGRKNTIETISPTGQNHQVVASYDASSTSDYLYQYSPNSFYIEVDKSSTDNPDYYSYSVGGTFKAVDNLTNDQLYDNPAYYFSADSGSVLWSEPRDGKSTLITGDTLGTNQTVAALGYDALGWYTGNYLLASKDSSELYIVSAAGAAPVKIADYETGTVY